MMLYLCGITYNYSQSHHINEQKYQQDFHPEVGKPNALIPFEDFAHILKFAANPFARTNLIVTRA